MPPARTQPLLIASSSPTHEPRELLLFAIDCVDAMLHYRLALLHWLPRHDYDGDLFQRAFY